MDRVDTFLLGLALGGALLMVAFLVGIEPVNRQLAEHRALITDCEKDKPRSIHCVLQAVEEKK